MTEEQNNIDQLSQAVSELSDIVDYSTFNKIINKLTDFAEILTIGKLSGIVNFNYRLNSEQTSEIINFLMEIQAISIIHNLAFKGTRDLEDEYISNIFSDPVSPENISSFISIRNLLENRLTHQIQQYNINMNKTNTTLAMPLNELRGHAKTYTDLTQSNLSISTKAQHGIISASLHDAYTILINKKDWWNDRTYMKFFFNEDDALKRNTLILQKKERIGLVDINKQVQEVLDLFMEIRDAKIHEEESNEFNRKPASGKSQGKNGQTAFLDKMLMTPFGRQYGTKIDSIISEMFSADKKEQYNQSPPDNIAEKIAKLYEIFTQNPKALVSQANTAEITSAVDYLITRDITLKVFTEKYLYTGRKESFNKFFTEDQKTLTEDFVTELYVVYFKEKFRSLFTIIKSLDMTRFSCAFIIKRIYLKVGEDITRFGYYLIRAVARVGGIKGQ